MRLRAAVSISSSDESSVMAAPDRRASSVSFGARMSTRPSKPPSIGLAGAGFRMLTVPRLRPRRNKAPIQSSGTSNWDSRMSPAARGTAAMSSGMKSPLAPTTTTMLFWPPSRSTWISAVPVG